MHEKYYKELEEILRELKVQPQPKLVANVYKKDLQQNQQYLLLLKEKEELQHKYNALQNENIKLVNKLNDHINEVKDIVEDANRARKNEKRLRNEILDLKGNCRVYCRVKPFIDKQLQIEYSDKMINLQNKKFEVDRVFGTKTTQQQIFMEMELFIENVLDGYKLCIFAYGQTGSGKTYTMEGNEDGLIFRSIKKLREILEGKKVFYTAKFIEIYNEELIDLTTQQKIHLQQETDGVAIKNVKEFKTDEIENILSMMNTVSKNRKTAETQSNTKSSRSHFLFVIDVEQHLEGEIRKGSLCLIDLAGSERIKNSKVKDDRLKETQNINKSLSVLGNVFTAIKQKSTHIPFRDSKLTHLMKNYLTGSFRTVMLVNINPEYTEESICSLRFGSKVSECVLGKIQKDILYKE